MDAALFVIGAVWIVLGTWTVLYTEGFRRAYGGMMKVVPLKVLGVIPIIMGVLIILSPIRSELFWLVVGILAVAKGVVLFGIPRERGERYLDWWKEEASEVLLRLGGLISVILGVFLALAVSG